MEIKALIKVKLKCAACGYDAAPPYVEVETESWSDLEEIVMHEFPGWTKIESSKGFVRYVGPECEKST